MATLKTSEAAGAAVQLSNGQAGNAVSTNVADRGPRVNGVRPGGVLRLQTTAGATPTVTVDIQGSNDNANWWNVPYALAATPETPSTAAVVVTTTATTYYHIRPGHAWRFLRCNYTANTNVTINDATFIDC